MYNNTCKEQKTNINKANRRKEKEIYKKKPCGFVLSADCFLSVCRSCALAPMISF